MSRLRIVCKGEAHSVSKDLRYPRLNPRPAVWSDVEATIVDDDGESKPITNITRIEWIAQQGTEPARARLDFVDVDVDLEVDLRSMQGLADAVDDWAHGRDGAVGRLAALSEAIQQAKTRR